jgi:uncharacterized membrane protein
VTDRRVQIRAACRLGREWLQTLEERFFEHLGESMADHGTHTSSAMDYEQAHSTYNGFLKGAVILTLVCCYVLVALCAFAFIDRGNVLIGFAGLIIGFIALIVDLRAGNNWYIAVAWLFIFGLFTAFMVS